MTGKRGWRSGAARLVVLALLISGALVSVAPPAHAAEPEAVYSTAIASHPNGWVTVAEWEFYRYNGTQEGFQRVLRLNGINKSGAAAWPHDIEISGGWGTNARNPKIAFNGTNFLVVWEDDRNGSWDIYGALVSPAGEILRQLPVSTATGDQLSPSVAGLGSQFLVVWQDHRVGANADIYSSRVSGTGTVASSAGVKISGAANLQANPSVAANGTQWMVVWNDKRSAATTGVDIYSTRVTSTGVVSNPAGVAVSRAARDQFKPVVAWNGTSFLAAWTDARGSTTAWDIYGSRISTAGVVLDSSGITINRAAGRQSQPTVSRSNTRVWVAWTNAEAYGSSIVGSFVASTATVSPVVAVTAPCTEATAGYNCDPSLPAAAAVGGTVSTVYKQVGQIFDGFYGQRVSSTGALLGAPYVMAETG